MRIKSNEKLRIATTHGAIILIEPNEITEVSQEIGALALQLGAVQVDEVVAVQTRARNEDGHFIADDPSTPDVNEAWQTKEVLKDEYLETIADAMQEILHLGNVDDFKGNGEPKASAVKRVLGEDTDSEQRAAAWAIVLER